jgi:hypothetical protein
MLLNLSNHPSSTWSEAQTAAALTQYSSLIDLAFPQIDPDWSSEQIVALAAEFCQQICNLNPRPQAVHLMGEMTFCFALVQKLQAKGIPCVASTTRRQTIDKGDGRKEVQFSFVQFRPYA